MKRVARCRFHFPARTDSGTRRARRRASGPGRCSARYDNDPRRIERSDRFPAAARDDPASA